MCTSFCKRGCACPPSASESIANPTLDVTKKKKILPHWGSNLKHAAEIDLDSNSQPVVRRFYRLKMDHRCTFTGSKKSVGRSGRGPQTVDPILDKSSPWPVGSCSHVTPCSIAKTAESWKIESVWGSEAICRQGVSKTRWQENDFLEKIQFYKGLQCRYWDPFKRFDHSIRQGAPNSV